MVSVRETPVWIKILVVAVLVILYDVICAVAGNSIIRTSIILAFVLLVLWEVIELKEYVRRKIK